MKRRLWEAHGLGSFYKTTADVASLHGAEVRQKLQCWCFIVSDWNWIVLCYVFLFFFSWPEDPQGPITDLLCSFKGPRHQSRNLAGCYSALYKNTHFSLTRVWQQQVWLVCANRWWRAEMARGSELSSLPARLSLCTWISACITLRNASSNIFPAGLCSSTRLDATDIYSTVRCTSLYYSHTFFLPAGMSIRCVPTLLSICLFPFVVWWLYLCLHTRLSAVKCTLTWCIF